jgi:hypothetical protein
MRLKLRQAEAAGDLQPESALVAARHRLGVARGYAQAMRLLRENGLISDMHDSRDVLAVPRGTQLLQSVFGVGQGSEESSGTESLGGAESSAGEGMAAGGEAREGESSDGDCSALEAAYRRGQEKKKRRKEEKHRE